MPKKRTEEMGIRYNELRAKGVKGNDAATQVNQEFKTSIDLRTVRRYGSEAKRKAEQEKATTPEVEPTTTTSDHKPTTDTKAEDLPPDTTDGVADTSADATPPVPPQDHIKESTAAEVVDTIRERTEDVTTPDTTREVASDRPTGEVDLTILTTEELQTMRDIIHWWDQGGQKTMERLTSVPLENLRERQTFPGKKTNSGIRINDRLFRAAVAKAKDPEEARRTGGSLSSLIEVLLWAYLDHDAKYLEPEPTSDAADPAHRAEESNETV